MILKVLFICDIFFLKFIFSRMDIVKEVMNNEESVFVFCGGI